MSLPARQQRVLDQIEHSLHACEPHLKSMFARSEAVQQGPKVVRSALG
jgi:hypothetical protein